MVIQNVARFAFGFVIGMVVEWVWSSGSLSMFTSR
jgi:hypothetical protein